MNWKSQISGISLFLTLAILATGCLTTSSRTNRRNRTSAATSATLRRHDEQITNLTFQSNQFKECEADIIRSLNLLNKRIARLSAENIDLKKRLAAMSNTLTSERSARKTELNGLLKEVSKQTAAAMAAAAKARAAAIAERTSRASRNAPSRKGPAMKGKFYVYTVEQGATLGAIAKAYKVSVAEIQKANRLSGDNIRIGQKLYIPKK
jgi:LysM repeat protein